MESKQDGATVDPMSKLKPQYKRFVAAYIGSFNAADAARQAGYSVKTARQQGQRLLTNDDIKAAVSSEGERLGMSAGEAVGRMTNWARGTLDPFLTPTGTLDMSSEQARDNIGLVKKFKHKKEYRRDGDGEVIISEVTEIELHDAKDATDKMLQIHGRYKQLPGDANQPKVLQGYTLPDGTKIVF